MNYEITSEIRYIRDEKMIAAAVSHRRFHYQITWIIIEKYKFMTLRDYINIGQPSYYQSN
uniref:Uncharacterized protein n=1 Tax=Arundo donax TaxID=35708 RepID=A0A0A9HEG6_ARUDO